MTNQTIYFKEVAPGRWLAATGVSPYFCFEGESQDAVFSLAARALAFHSGAKNEVQPQLEAHRERTRAIPTFDNKHTISARELAAA